MIAERIVERANVNPDGPSISFNNSSAEKQSEENILTLPNNLQMPTRIPDEKIYNSRYKVNINRMHKINVIKKQLSNSLCWVFTVPCFSCFAAQALA